jgi:hypothetical protein
LSVSLFVCQSVCLSVCLSVLPPVCQSVCLSVCLFVSLFVCQSVCLSVCLSLSLFVSQSVCLSVCLSVSLFIVSLFIVSLFIVSLYIVSLFIVSLFIVSLFIVSPSICLSVCPSLHLSVLLPKDLLTILIHNFILNSKIACKWNRNPKYKPKPILFNFYVQVIIPFHCKNVFFYLIFSTCFQFELKKLEILSIVNDCRLATERRE